MSSTGTRFYDVAEPGTLHANTDFAVEPQFLRTITELAVEVGDPVDEQAFFTVTIVPEPDNPRSELGRALSVRWRDRVIGYLSSEDADRYQQLRRIVASGYTPVSRGRIFVGGRVTDDRRDYFLSVSLRKPEVLIPLNDPPADPWVLLPHGKKVQVTGESAHLDVLLNRVPRGGVGQVLVSLHEIAGNSPDAADAPLVEVRLDGKRIGQLSASDGAGFLPAVRHFADQGQLTVARARLQGSPLSAEVTLQAAMAADLTEEDLAADARPLPTLVDAREDARMYPVPDAFQGETPGRAQGGAQGGAPKNPFTRPTTTRTVTTRTTVIRSGPPAGRPVQQPPRQPVHQPTQQPVRPPAQTGAGAGTVISSVLLWIGIAVGAVLLLGGIGLLGETVVDGIGGMMVGLSVIAPCAWPMVCRSQDRKALVAWEEDQATSRELASYLTEEDAVVAKGLGPTPPPTPVSRRWGRVGAAAGVVAVVGLTLMVVSGVGEEPDEGPGQVPGVSTPG